MQTLQTLGFFLFISISIGSLFGIQYYILRRLRSVFNFKYKHKTVIILFALSLLPLALMITGRVFWNGTFKIIYTLLAVYLGSAWILFVFFLTIHIITFLIKIIFKKKLSKKILLKIKIATITGLAILLPYTLYVGNVPHVKRVEIKSNKIDKSVKIVQLTDLHLGPIHNEDYLKMVVDKVKKLNPDIVVITGDVFDGVAEIKKETFKIFDEITVPKYFVYGNHEFYEGIDKITKIINQTSINILKNTNVIIEEKNIQIIGIDNMGIQKSDLSSLDNIKFKKDKFILLLSHSPVTFNDLDQYPINLEIAGHTHGGQIFPFNLLVKIFFPQIKGLYEQNEKYIYVSPGTGTWGPPMRFGSQNEITLIELKPM